MVRVSLPDRDCDAQPSVCGSTLLPGFCSLLFGPELFPFSSSLTLRRSVTPWWTQTKSCSCSLVLSCADFRQMDSASEGSFSVTAQARTLVRTLMPTRLRCTPHECLRMGSSVACSRTRTQRRRCHKGRAARCQNRIT
jgi:hypothetical protein